MAKVRVYEIAKELGVQPKELLEMLESIGMMGKVPSSSIEDTAARSLRQMIANKQNGGAAPVEAPAAPPAPAAPRKFADFRATERRPAAPVVADVVSDRVQDFREVAAQAEGVVVQNPAKSGPGARSDAAMARPVAPPPAPTPAPAAPPAPRGFSTGGGVARPGAPAAPGAAPAPGAPGAAPGTPARPAGPGPGFGGNRPAFNANKRMGNFRGGRQDRVRLDDRRSNRRVRFEDLQNEPEQEEAAKQEAGTKLSIPQNVTVTDLAQMLDRSPSELIKKLFSMNIMRAANQPLTVDLASNLAKQYGYDIEVETSRVERHLEEVDTEALVPVPPVVTIMGHVDHGKTSLLDIIRSANVQAGEAGGITQRIGAYEVEHNGEKIVFLDTPGHEAFTRMRARGAHITDIAILVVAADDGVMPQTREAIDHARAAKVPIIVAMNKMDRAEADPNRVKGELAEVDLIPEDYGGDVVVIPVSAKTGMGVQELLDMVLLVAELQELKANPEGHAQGTIIEANQDANRGAVATVMVHKGTLRVGDYIVVGEVHGRVRAMFDFKGDPVSEAPPKKPVSILGLSRAPQASDQLQVMGSAREAREAAEAFTAETRNAMHVQSQVSLRDLYSKIQKGAAKDLNIIVKADGQGSLEAMAAALQKLEHAEVRVRIIARGVGNVGENDVNLAEASQAIIIGFGVQTDNGAATVADRDNVEIRTYNVIYDAINDVTAALEGMLAPIYEEKFSGEAEVRAIFEAAKVGKIAGCFVLEGRLVSGSTLRVWRQNRKIFEGRLDSLRHVKADVKEMVAGQECGVAVKNFNDFREGDILQSIILERIKRGIEDNGREPNRVGPPGSYIV
jgi:translation initiation factor IF-2